MRIHAAGPAEHERVRALRLRALASDPTAFGATHADEAAEPPEFWRNRLEDPRAQTFLLDDDRGLCTGYERDGTVELVGLWVAPEARGNGAGAALVQAVLAWARARGAARIGLWVNVDQRAAAGLYRQCGFADVGGPVAGTTFPERTFQRMEQALR